MPIANDPDDSMLGEQLRRLRVDPSDGAGAEFRALLHRKLVAAGGPAPVGRLDRWRDFLARRPIFGWPVAGLLTGVTAFVLLFGWQGVRSREVRVVATAPATAPQARTVVSRQPANGPGGDIKPTYDVPAARVAVINLNFSADVAVEDVTFEVKLPEGLSFWSQGQALAEREFRWPGTLEAGENILPIAVRGERPGLYRVKARAEIDDQVIEHEILLHVKGQDG